MTAFGAAAATRAVNLARARIKMRRRPMAREEGSDEDLLVQR
jgi:hypothetical protein